RAGIARYHADAHFASDRARARATRASRAKSQFLSHMNHALRTPMNAILGFSEMIKSKSFGNNLDKYAEYAEIIHDSGRHLLSLINDMIDLSKIEGGKLYLREIDLNIAHLVGEEYENNYHRAEKAGLSFIKSIEAEMPNL